MGETRHSMKQLSWMTPKQTTQESSVKPMSVPEKFGSNSGITPGNAKLPLEEGEGSTAMVQAIHQLHCLNLLRKATWYSYDYYSDLQEHEFAKSPEILQMHVGMLFTASFGYLLISGSGHC